MDHRLLQQVIFGRVFFRWIRRKKSVWEGCSCGRVLHRADFRGSRAEDRRICRRSTVIASASAATGRSCRKRVTPPSVRFLGRKVYLHAVIILVAALRQGATPRRPLTGRTVRDRPAHHRPLARSFGRSSFRRPRSGRSHAALLPLVTPPRCPESCCGGFSGRFRSHRGLEEAVGFSPITITGSLKS